MACKTSFELHHNFPKIAEESGFAFNTHRPKVHLEWNKIRLIDIESLTRERKFVIIEEHLNDILDCVLQSEFDVRILDEGVLKIFRLAQLTVEYQQFCRHYLDQTVYVLREQISALAQELDYAKKTIREKDEEIRKLKRKTKHSFKTALPYGNDNIASMILQTLANKTDIFPSTSNNDNVHYNKCSYCEKVFLNQLYLQGHISRRHANVREVPQKDTIQEHQIPSNETSKLKDEVTELKCKLREMETLIKTTNANFKSEIDSEANKNCNKIPVKQINMELESNINKNIVKEMKDVEVSANIEDQIFDKIKEWKDEEYERYNKEISLLRTQITNIIDFYKETDRFNSVPNEKKLMEQLNETIKQQGAEIAALKDELTNSTHKRNNEESEKRKQFEAQIAFWTERAELQANEYKLLVKKLDDLAKEAQESDVRAQSESERASKLQILLEQALKSSNIVNNQTSNNNKNIKQEYPNNDTVKRITTKCKPIPDHNTLEKLHRRAQELLNIEPSTSSETPSNCDDKIKLIPKRRKYQYIKSKSLKNIQPSSNNSKIQSNEKAKIRSNNSLRKNTGNDIFSQNTEKKYPKDKKSKSPPEKGNGRLTTDGSPLKIVRAKLTEEVNQRLMSLGLDPLKNKLPRTEFQKYRSHLQENSELKSKKNPNREKVYHSIIANLDNNDLRNQTILQNGTYTSPSKSSMVLNVTSDISNVKSKQKCNRITYDKVSKKANSSLKTPPESVTSSPKVMGYDKSIKEYSETTKDILKSAQKENDGRNEYINHRHKISFSNSDIETNNQSDTSNESNEKTQTGVSKSELNLINSPKKYPYISKKRHSHTLDNLTNANGALKTTQTKLLTYLLKNEATKNNLKIKNDESSDDSFSEHILRKALSEENIPRTKQTKGVLKNASSTSSLNKKTVVFDLDAIQMKSISASPSQSTNEKIDNNEKHVMGIINLENEEWDISSIESEIFEKEEKALKISTRTSPKIAELKHSIESQLTRRNQTLSTAIVGGVDVLTGPNLVKTASLGGSNTSLGSSILDETDNLPHQNHIAIVKPKGQPVKDDSEIDISELVADTRVHA